MTQSRVQSFIEAWANTAVGFVLSLALQFFLAWLYNYQTTAFQNVQIVIWFTVLSVIRNYYLRRYFNRLHNKNNKGASHV